MARLILAVLLCLTLDLPLTVYAVSGRDFANKVGNSKLECYVCNSAFEYCGDNKKYLEDMGKIAKCDVAYYEKVYGKKVFDAVDLEQFPQAVSEWALKNTGTPVSAREVGWIFGTYPTGYHYSVSPKATPHPYRYRFSSASMELRLNPDVKMNRCFKMVIQTGEQNNDGHVRTIVKEPEGIEYLTESGNTGRRVIRGCSYSTTQDKDCKIYHQGKPGVGTVKLCYSKESRTNNASYIGISQAGILATTVLVLAWRWLLGG